MGFGGTKRYFALAAALLAAALGYAWFWHTTAAKIRAGIPALTRTAAELGYAIRLAGPKVSGFPFRFVVDFSSVDLETGSPPGNWRLQAEGVTGYAQPWDLSHVIFGFRQPVSVRVRDRLQTITSGRALLSLSVKDHNLHRLSLDVLDGSVADPSGAPPWEIARLQAHFQRTADGVRVSLTANGIVLPEPMAGMPSRRIELVQVNGTLTGDVPPSVALDDFKISWPPLEIDGAGILTLDSERYPAGSIRAFVRGHGALVDLLEASGVLRPRKAAVTRAALGVLQSSQNDAQGRLSIKVELQDGRLYLGPVKVMRLPSF